ncbi:unnamed protein product [Brachionus calyciflorus]|uniref:Uncharacterized protein n=1 Tax=Brachionus calyciflorus TaxID=104777 RepID=A0A813M5K1_9BILA|nr:unnamed protein product [Brachionus calyciflorus]
MGARLCTSSKQFHKSMDDLNYERNLAEPSNNSSKKSKILKNSTVEKKPKEKPTSHISEDMRAKNLAFIPANNIERINQLTSSRHSLLIKDENLEPKRMSNGSMKSESSVNLLNSQNRKPLPSYSEVIQSKYNQNDANKNRNSVVFNYQQYSSQLLNNQGNNMNSEYRNQRTSQVNQPILSSQPVNLMKQQSQQMPNNQHHLSKINQFNNDINVQQSRSKSLDPSLYIDSNQINNENQNFNEDHLIMPYQSAAIQERLKQFEQQNSINNDDIYIKQKKHLPSVESRTDILNIARKGSPFENQNKENSPFSSNIQLASNINMTNNQRQNLYQLVKNDPESKILYTTKNNNLTNLNSTKSASNISLIKISNTPKQTYNPNLIAATAAAAAAIEQQNKTENLSRVYQSFPEKREKSQEKLEVKNEPVNSKTSNYGQIDYSNVLKRAMTFEQKGNEQQPNVQKSSTPIFSDNNSSKPTSRQNSPLKSVIKNALNQNEDVEMSTASSTSNKENNSESNEQSNEPSKLSISEKLKLFSGSGANTNTTNNNVQNLVTFTTLNMNQNKKTSQSTSKINFNKFQNVSTESTSLPKPTSNLASTKSFNYCDRSTVLRENINKSNNSDDNSLSNKPIESLASIKSRFESKSNQDSTIDNVVNMTHDNTESVNSDSQSSQKDSKRSLRRPKLDSPKLNEQFSNENKNQHESSPLPISMTIQERMAALKKNNGEDWRKRSTSASNEEKSSTTSNLVKQQKEQIKQQLDQINLSSKSKSNIKRNVLIPFLNEMKASQKHENISDDNEDFNNNNIKKNRISQSNESLDKLMNHNQNILNEKPPRKIENKRPSPVKQSKLTRIQSGGSDTDSMLARNTSIITKPNLNKYKPEKIELFSTDSEMDSFFKDDILLNNNAFSSHSSGTKTDDNTMNEDFDEDEFDQIVSDAKRLTQEARARPHRKTKSKGNHLKNLQNRIEIKNEYEQKHLPIMVDELTEEQQRQIKEQAALVNEITRMNRFNKN